MSMRKQLYQWNINKQVNGYSLPITSTGTIFQNIQGIPISIFIGGIGNNITEPAATKATQFITIDSIRGSPSFFLSGAGVMARFNYLADLLVVKTSLDSTDVASTNFGAGGLFNLDVGARGMTNGNIGVPFTNSGVGTGGIFLISTNAGAPATTYSINFSGGSGYVIGDKLTWRGVVDVVARTTATDIGPTSATDLSYTIKAGDLATYADVTSIPLDAGSTSANPKYTPNTIDKPELTFQGTHINPFTSVAGPLMFMQVVINTTNYFDETDGTTGPGLPATSSPCPETTACRTSFEFESPIYILPGQQWDVRVSLYNDSRADIGSVNKGYNGESGTGVEDLCCLVQYTLYDGPDALVANKLVEMGVAVVPENVDWYKRQLLEGTL